MKNHSGFARVETGSGLFCRVARRERTVLKPLAVDEEG